MTSMEINKDKLLQIWQQGRSVKGFDDKMFRKDACGAWIVWNKYGLSDNDYGWVVDHIVPVSMGGDDDMENLRPIHILNSISKRDDYPSYVSVVTSNGADNVKRTKVLKVNRTKRNKLEKKYKIDL